VVATSFDEFGPFDSGPGADVMEDTWRRIFRHMLASGVLSGAGDELDVYADSTGMQVKVPSGEVWIRGHWGENETEKTLPIAAAPTAVGESRIDRVIARADFGANLIELDVLTGTATTATPTVPALTRNTLMWEIGLKQVTVAEDVVTIAPGDVTADDRLFVGEIATSGRPRLKLRRTTTIDVPSISYTLVPWEVEDLDNTGMWDAGTPGEIVIRKAGLWEFSGQLRYSANTGGDRFVELTRNATASGTTGAGEVRNIQAGRGGDGNNVLIQWKEDLAVGDVIRCYAYQDSSVTLSLGTSIGGCNLSAFWVSPSERTG
jgi:hypothetical protein